MRLLDVEYIANGAKGELYARACGETCDTCDNVVIDSRQAKEGSLFFCIIGARTDAHNYLEAVREQGCRSVVVSDREWADKIAAHGDMNVILVPDTTRALMDLATKYMDDWKDLKKIAVTGSVGKTSTKEFLYSVLSSEFKTGRTPGNLNSEFGIPLTVFGFDTDIEVAVIEVGIGSGPDMAELVKMFHPDAAVVTTIGSSHMEYFGSQDKLIEAKLRVSSTFGDDNLLVVNSDCSYLTPDSVRAHSEGSFRLMTVGGSDSADYVITDVKDLGINGASAVLTRGGEQFELRLPVIGAHNLGNAALAVAIGEYMGISIEKCLKALMNTELAANRLDVRRTDKYTLINDTYNASPESMMAGLDIIANSEAARSVAVLGDMGELGDNAASMHAKVGHYAAARNIDLIVTIGSMSVNIAEAYIADGGAMTVSYETREDAIEKLPELLNEGDVILVKASRAMGLEKLSFALTEGGENNA